MAQGSVVTRLTHAASHRRLVMLTCLAVGVVSSAATISRSLSRSFDASGADLLKPVALSISDCHGRHYPPVVSVTQATEGRGAVRRSARTFKTEAAAKLWREDVRVDSAAVCSSRHVLRHCRRSARRGSPRRAKARSATAPATL